MRVLPMIVYLATDFETAQKILNGDWGRNSRLLYKDISHAMKRAMKITPVGTMPVVLELHYTQTRKLNYNPHKCGYHTSLKPRRIRIKWIAVNGGLFTFNYARTL